MGLMKPTATKPTHIAIRHRTAAHRLKAGLPQNAAQFKSVVLRAATEVESFLFDVKGERVGTGWQAG